jgi:hypothetical protein
MEAGDDAAVAELLTAAADLDSRSGNLRRAVRRLAAAQAMRTPSSEMWMRTFVAPWPGGGLAPEALRARLADDEYAAQWREGEALGTRRAVEEATG